MNYLSYKQNKQKQIAIIFILYPFLYLSLLLIDISYSIANEETNYLKTINSFEELDKISEKGSEYTEWVKFIILESNSDVFFQNSRKYPLHFDFAHQNIPLFKNMNFAEFSNKSLYNHQRLAYVGTLLKIPNVFPQKPSWGLQIVSIDSLNIETIRLIYNTIAQKTLQIIENEHIYLIPTNEQKSDFSSKSQELARYGIHVRNFESFFESASQQIYSSGFSSGRLVKTNSKSIDQDFKSGKIQESDIVLIDEILAEMPPVSGLISLSVSVPTSHTSLLFQQESKPFIYCSNPVTIKHLETLVGKEIFLLTNGINLIIQTKEEGLTSYWNSYLQELRSTKISAQPIKEISFSKILKTGTYDYRNGEIFGSKSANFSEMTKILKENQISLGAGIPFYFFEKFLDMISDGKTIRKHIDSVIVNNPFPFDKIKLSNDLFNLQERIINTKIPDDLYKNITSQLIKIFPDKSQMLFLRSSTNAEDNSEFNGAGLYSSKQGRICDDDLSCNQLGNKRYPLSLALKKVWASLFNFNAFISLQKFGIKVENVAMGILVNPFHTGIKANGVAIVNTTGPNLTFEITAQKELFEVTNPDPGIRPEIMKIQFYGAETNKTLVQSSSLLPLGWNVLSNDDYNILSKALKEVYNRYKNYTTLPLDFEWLKLSNGKIVLTQVRPIPNSLSNSKMKNISPIVFGKTKMGLKSCVFENESTARFLRSKIALTFDIDLHHFNNQLTNKNIIHNFSIQFGPEINQHVNIDHMNLLPNYFSQFNLINEFKYSDHYTGDPFVSKTEAFIQSFLIPKLPPLNFSMQQTYLKNEKSGLLSDPFIFQPVPFENNSFHNSSSGQSSQYYIEINHNTRPIESFPEIDSNNSPHDLIRLCPFDPIKGLFSQSEDTIRSYSEFVGAKIKISMDHFVTNLDSGKIIKTYNVQPLSTTFYGILQKPFTISNWFATAYSPEHHNFSEEFLFDIEKEINLPKEIINELRKKNIRWLSLSKGYFTNHPKYGLIGLSPTGEKIELASDLEPVNFPRNRNE